MRRAGLTAGLLRHAFPECCPACRGSTAAGFCGGCAGEFRLLAEPCRACGLPLPASRCPRRGAAWHVDRVWAPFEYRAPLDHYLQQLKFGRGRALGRALALLLAGTFERAAAPVRHGAEALLPVPLHGARLRGRGYNQAAEIARALGAELGLPVMLGAAARRGPAGAQSLLGARARRENVAQAFEVACKVEGRRVAIVDDVITTGATVNALAAALRAKGAAGIEAWAVARTIPKRREQADQDVSVGRVQEAGGASPAASRNT